MAALTVKTLPAFVLAALWVICTWLICVIPPAIKSAL
jgi:hypothetical protein